MLQKLRARGIEPCKRDASGEASHNYACTQYRRGGEELMALTHWNCIHRTPNRMPIVCRHIAVPCLSIGPWFWTEPSTSWTATRTNASRWIVNCTTTNILRCPSLWPDRQAMSNRIRPCRWWRQERYVHLGNCLCHVLIPFSSKPILILRVDRIKQWVCRIQDWDNVA